jgi:uncharacterized protein (DUF433 family)
MKKHSRVFIVVALAALLILGGSTVAYAWGPGGLGGRTGAQGSEAVAEELGLTSEELCERLQAGETLADIAEAAGVPLTTLKAAADAARQTAVAERIEQAVADEQLTREQADWMLQGIELGYGLSHGFRGMPLAPMMLRGFGNSSGLDVAADALGMTVDELTLQMWGGRTLADLAERQGVDLETVQNAIEAARQDAMRQAIQQAVEGGRLTEEQAEWLLQGIEQGYAPMGSRVGPHTRGAKPGMMGRFGGSRRGTPLDSAPDAGWNAPGLLRGLSGDAA